MIILTKSLKFLLIGIITVVSLTVLILFQLGVFIPPNNNSTGGNEGIGLPITYKETVSNISLYVDYGNETINVWVGFSLFNYNTSVFHAIYKVCDLEYEYYPIYDDYLITSINGISQNSSHAWHFWVNGVISPVGSYRFALDNDSIINWNFTTGTYS